MLFLGPFLFHYEDRKMTKKQQNFLFRGEGVRNWREVIPDTRFDACHLFWLECTLGAPGRCPSTVRLVFPVLVFQPRKQQNRTRTTSSTVLGTPLNRTLTKKFPFRRALRRLPCWLALNSELGIHWKLGLSPLGTAQETVLRHVYFGCSLQVHKDLVT